MKALAVIPVLLWLSASAAGAEGAGPSALLTLGGVTLWEPFEPVRTRLGKPLRIIVDDGAAFGTQYVYEGLTLWAGYGAKSTIDVLQIEVTGVKYCTPTGVCPGTSLAEARRKLGKPLYPETLSSGKSRFDIGEDGCWLEVVVADAAVRSMAIRCQP